MKNFGEKLLIGYVYFCLVWVTFALFLDIFFIYLNFNNPQLGQDISNQIMWKIDGTFKNDPNNIWYEEPSK